MPYRDAWDHKQPLTYFLFALSLLLGSHTLWGIWAIEWVFLLVAGIAGYFWLTRVAPRWISLLAVLAAFLTLNAVIWGFSLEELSLPFQVLALAGLTALLSRPRTWRGAAGIGLALGALAGTVFFLKQSLVGLSLVIAVYLGLRALLCREVRCLHALGGMAAGFALIAAGILIYFWRVGALEDYWTAAFAFNLQYANLGLVERLKGLLDGLETISAFPGLFVAFALWLVCAAAAVFRRGPVAAAWIRKRYFGPAAAGLGFLLMAASLAGEMVGSRPGLGLVQVALLVSGASLAVLGLVVWRTSFRPALARWLENAALLPNLESAASAPLRSALLDIAALFFPAVMLLIAASGRNYTYYFISLIPVLMLEAGLVGGVLVDLLRPAGGSRFAAALLLAVFAALAYNPLLQISAALQTRPDGDIPVVDYITARTRPDDPILAWGKNSTYIYTLAGRQAPTRYFYQAPVFEQAFNADHGVVKEMLRDFQAKPPKLFLHQGELDHRLTGSDPAECLRAAADMGGEEPVFAFICSRYRYDTRLSGFEIFQLK